MTRLLWASVGICALALAEAHESTRAVEGSQMRMLCALKTDLCRLALPFELLEARIRLVDLSLCDLGLACVFDRTRQRARLCE